MYRVPLDAICKLLKLCDNGLVTWFLTCKRANPCGSGCLTIPIRRYDVFTLLLQKEDSFDYISYACLSCQSYCLRGRKHIWSWLAELWDD